MHFSTLDRDLIGQILTVIGGVLLALILGFWLFAQMTGAVALTVAQLPGIFIAMLVGVVVSGGVALAATAINGWQLRQAPRRDRAVATGIAGATLIVALLFLFVTLVPHVRVAQFAQSFAHACATPLTGFANDIAAADAAIKQTTDSDSDFSAAAARYAAIFQHDGAAIPGDIAQLQALSVPAAKYQRLIDDCAAEYHALATFLVGTNGVTLPSILPPPFGGMSLSAQSLLALAGSVVAGTATGLPKLPAFLMGNIIAIILDAIPTTCDATCQNLKADGDQLAADVFAPFKLRSA